MTQLAAANNPAHRTMLESALKSINDEMGREGPKPRPREEVKLLEVSASEFEQLSAKTAEILEAAAVAYKRIAIDQEEIEQLKTETRALLAGLRAA
jgi:hypothetical protein